MIRFLFFFFLVLDLAASTKLYILGTGTPNPNPERAGSSYLLLVEDKPYLIDFGSGVVRRVAALTKAWGGDLDIDTEDLEHAFLTHMHSDHNLGLADLIITPWIMGREHKLVLHGPKALDNMAKNLIEAFEFDINYRINGTQPQNNTGFKYDFNQIFDGYIYEDNLVKVEAFKNSHGDLEESYGFVFQTPHKKIVFSGDTGPSEKLLLKAKGADILIHEVYSQAGFDKKTPDWQIYHAAHHTSPKELGEIASKIKPKKLILSHILFWDAKPEDIKREVQLFYDGEVIVAEDLLVVD